MYKQINSTISGLMLLTLLLSSLLPAMSAKAATTPAAAANTGQALEIAPPLIYLNVSPGQSVKTQVLIRDVSATDLNVIGEVNDFVASGEDGTPKVLIDQNQVDPYSLKSWVLAVPSLQLVPRQIKTLPISIQVPVDASPGGHYGVIRFTGTAPSVNGGNGVSLSASIGALMLLTVSGKINESLTVKDFSVNHNGTTGSFFQSGPVAFTERVNNAGNVHEQPTGLVTIKDMFGHKLATLPVNQPPGNVLPASTRKFTQSLDSSVIGNKKLFGHYTATLSLTYGASKKTLTATTSFWVVPLKTVAIVIAILIAGFFALRYGLQRYNRSVVNRANKTRGR